MYIDEQELDIIYVKNNYLEKIKNDTIRENRLLNVEKIKIF